ncbi:MAG: hypothetical protein CMF04_03575 [Hyphomonas sp.]|nr:hypothetical protein [Hyphomonas sp.]
MLACGADVVGHFDRRFAPIVGAILHGAEVMHRGLIQCRQRRRVGEFALGPSGGVGVLLPCSRDPGRQRDALVVEDGIHLFRHLADLLAPGGEFVGRQNLLLDALRLA